MVASKCRLFCFNICSEYCRLFTQCLKKPFPAVFLKCYQPYLKQEGHDGPGVAHLSLLTQHNQFPTSCEIYVLPNNRIFTLISLNLLHKTNNMWIKLWDWSLKGVENIMKKEKNAGYQHFLIFKECFLRVIHTLGFSKISPSDLVFQPT